MAIKNIGESVNRPILLCGYWLTKQYPGVSVRIKMLCISTTLESLNITENEAKKVTNQQTSLHDRRDKMDGDPTPLCSKCSFQLLNQPQR